MRGGAITDLQALKDLFIKAETPNWTLYRGFHKNMPHSQIIYKQDDKNMDIEMAWDELEHMLTVHSGGGVGQFTIYVPAQSHNKGYSWWFQVGQMPNQQNAGLGGMYSNPAAVGMVPAAQVQLEKQIWNLERQLEDLEAAREAQQSVGQQILDKVLAECDMNQVVNAAVGLLGRFVPNAPKGAPISLQGHPADNAPDTPGEATAAGYQYEEGYIIPILDTIRPHFQNDQDFYRFLTTVAQLFASNPEGFKAMVNAGS